MSPQQLTRYLLLKKKKNKKLIYSKSLVKKVLYSDINDKEFIKLVPIKRDRDLIKLARKLDYTQERDRKERIEGENFEKEFNLYFKQFGHKYLTENQLKALYSREAVFVELDEINVIAEKTSENYLLITKITAAQYKQKRNDKIRFQLVYRFPGETEKRYHAKTPDFVISPDSNFSVTYDTSTYDVTWIDCKNFLGGVSKRLDLSAIQQGLKYFKLFGQGIIVYKFGYTESFLEEIKQNIDVKGKVLFLPYASMKALRYTNQIQAQ